MASCISREGFGGITGVFLLYRTPEPGSSLFIIGNLLSRHTRLRDNIRKKYFEE
ncbi:hypothetical protein [Agriterribacter sp.]|uniref:hypothetical protein n=1 Tax=Agriterribacter sp. TaxID=2821509 RepID=UPI002BE6ED6C|nr:hypothetical protein [Agriterribacter sp.]HRP57038.1 hypothetical protein [Agriterribacter sp.]